MESIYKYGWIIPLLPLVSSIIIGLGLFFFPKATKSLRRTYAIISTLLLSIAMFISFDLFWQQIAGSPTYRYLWSWIPDQDVTLEVGYPIDPLTSIMLVLVTTIGVTVMIHSDSYMSHDQGYVRFFAYLSLSTASMLGLVISPNLIQIYIFRELVGMCSYLLIGFWFTRPSAANACQKAFITNRVGDFGLLLGTSGFYWITGSFKFEDLFERFNESLANHEVSLFLATPCALLFPLGPVAKSAQFPLHVWLPDAMEGPTPISAPIHAATMVAAGIFLVARMFPLFKTLPLVMSSISWVGGVTASLGATVALAQKDLKRVLAYSTMSQLGYMMLALGIGSYRAASFHLITHAYPKALSSPGSGSVIHSMEPIVGYCPDKSQNIALMGGLRKYVPITGTTFLLGTLSLCGIPPLACFWSKDEIIADSWLYFPILGWIARFTAGLTGFYTFRMYFLTLEGDFRANPSKNLISSYVSPWENLRFGTSSQKQTDSALPLAQNRIESFNPSENIQEFSDKNVKNSVSTQSSREEYSPHPKESDNTMLFPLLILTIPTLLVGFIGVPSYQEEMGPDLLSHWLDPSLSLSNQINYENWLLEFIANATVSVGTASLGIFTASIPYGPIPFFPRDLRQKTDLQLEGILGHFSSLLYNWSYSRGYIDGYYNIVFIKGTRILAKIISFFDQWIIDGIVNGVGISGSFGGEGSRYGEGGRISYYLFGFISGTIILLLVVINYKHDFFP
uniref:NADH-plastoquinone oxidoreductase subunit 5 n=1 Tax=Huperzia arctica TaxID=669708 RepID=UPI0023D7C2D6|nr:NADH-plastoquinone oxidoreductase subunit 5 [Huperzia arctica]WDR47120.1 NADH-plastoquinone oxidoreductase subunit 5 [Huperzia arctica]